MFQLIFFNLDLKIKIIKFYLLREFFLAFTIKTVHEITKKKKSYGIN